MSVTGITETTQYLTFKLEEEVFALDIAKVREVLDFTADNQGAAHPGVHEGGDKPQGQCGASGGHEAEVRDDEDRKDSQHLHNHRRDRP